MTVAIWREEPTVFAVDCDAAFCQIVRSVARSLELRAEFFDSVPKFLKAADPAKPGCLVLDPSVPGGSLGELLDRLSDRRVHLPVIVASACGDVAVVVAAMRAGALNYLEKPCREALVADALQEAIAADAHRRPEIASAATIRRRLSRLTAGERRVLEMLVHGMTNQQVAASLGLSIRAVEARRAKIRHKMRSKSLADLIRQVSLATGSARHA
jgi:FixJ family two-component response regulator